MLLMATFFSYIKLLKYYVSSAVGARDTAASPSKKFLGQNWSEIWEKV